MFEHISAYPTDHQYQILEHNQSFEPNISGLNKILAVGYDRNKSQRLPISRYSLHISVIGLCTTGTVSGIGLAALGHKVIAVDHNKRKVNALNQGQVASVDSKLKALLKQVHKLNNLVASCNLHDAILSTDVTMICANNNCLQKATEDSGNITSIVEQISSTLQSKRNFHLIVICQSVIRTGIQNFIGTYIEKSTGKTLGKDFGLCFVPLELSEHQALSDFYTLPNMNITASDTKSEKLIEKLFNGFNNKIKYTRYIKT